MATEGSLNEPLELDIQTDEYGNWSTEILNNLEPGVHTAVLQTSDGREQDVAFFVLQDEPGVIEQVQSVVPPFFNGLILVLFALICLLSWNSIRLARKMDKTNRDKMNMRYTKGAILLSVAAIVIALVVGIFVNKDNEVFEDWFDTSEPTLVTVSGTVLDPLTESGVEGVDLTVGKVSVHTSNTGSYTFPSIDKTKGIKITHPKLIRSLRYQVQGEASQNIYFNAEMYNLLINVVNNEARGLYQDNYQYVHRDIKNAVDEIQYARDHESTKSIFSLDDLADQELGISSVRVISSWTNEMYTVKFDNVVEIEVLDDDMKQTFYLISTDDGWRMAD